MKVKREPKPKIKKEPAEPKPPKVKKEKKEANGEPASLADRMKKKRKSTDKPKKNPWETDSEEESEISDFSAPSDVDSDGDFRPAPKKPKPSSSRNGATVKTEPDSTLGNEPICQPSFQPFGPPLGTQHLKF